MLGMSDFRFVFLIPSHYSYPPKKKKRIAKPTAKCHGYDKSPTSEKRWEGPRLLNGGAAHSFRLAFWRESNDPVTNGIRANSDLTPMSRQTPSQVR